MAAVQPIALSYSFVQTRCLQGRNIPQNRKRGVKKYNLTTCLTSVKDDDNSDGEMLNLKWKLVPSKDHTNKLERFKLKLAAAAIKLDCKLKREKVPVVLCPPKQAVLEAYVDRKKVARFGITTTRGPSAPPIDETVQDIYQVDASRYNLGVGAIIYMFVEEDYRGKRSIATSSIGKRALDIVSAIHAYQGCDFTILLADDDGSGKLVQWYQDWGFNRAPKLQTLMGSPDGQLGIAMISPVKQGTQSFWNMVNLKW